MTGPRDELGGGIELVAGAPREILLALAVGDRDAFFDPDRVVAYLPLGELQPEWLDALTVAVRDVRGRGPSTFRAALRPLAVGLERAVEEEVWLVDGAWVEALADVADEALALVGRRWLAGLGEHEPTSAELAVATDLAAAVIRFARRSATAPAVLCVSATPILDLDRSSGD